MIFLGQCTGNDSVLDEKKYKELWIIMKMKNISFKANEIVEENKNEENYLGLTRDQSDKKRKMEYEEHQGFMKYKN